MTLFCITAGVCALFRLPGFDVLGSGNFGRVYRGVWRGTVVAAKVIPVPSSNKKVWENEIDAYK